MIQVECFVCQFVSFIFIAIFVACLRQINIKMSELENVNPLIFKKAGERKLQDTDYDDNVIDVFDEREVFGNFTQFSQSLTFNL